MLKILKGAAAVVVVSAALMGANSAYAADKTWAVFDSKRAMEGTKHFLEAKAALEKELNSRQTQLQAQKKALAERRDALEAKKAVASSAGLVEQEGELVQEEQQLSQTVMKAQRELALFEQKIKEQLFGRLEVAVQEVATTGGHTFVIDGGRVLYHVPSIDITDKVLKAYEKRFGDKPLDLSAVKLSQAGNGAPTRNR